MTNTANNNSTIVVAGASGFVGRSIENHLGDHADLIGLSRTPKADSEDGYRWRQCNLFSRHETYRATQGADLGIYLVHSMQPSSKLSQADFRDLDLLCADNFARAASRRDFDHIIYVSGIIPETNQLSAHLSSRLEVEETLGQYSTPVTTLRAGLIVGAGGSSTEILLRLVDRLPVMGLPSWTKSQSNPIDIDDLTALIEETVAQQDHFGCDYDVGGDAPLSYANLLRRTADALGKKRIFVPIPILSPRLSTLWVSLFSGYSPRLVRPLVESLKHDMTPRDQRLQKELGQSPLSFDDSIKKAIEEKNQNKDRNVESLPAKHKSSLPAKTHGQVRSVQRLPLPPRKSARWVGREYARWLPDFLWPFIDVQRPGEDILQLHIAFIPKPLLRLRFDHEVSAPDRQLYWVEGGLLAEESDWGRLEFRKVLDGKYVLAALHDFEPRLPWVIYRYTQALIHIFVMYWFKKHLAQIAQESR